MSNYQIFSRVMRQEYALVYHFQFALAGVKLFIGVAELIVAITAAVLCCRVVCCGKRPGPVAEWV